MCNISLYLCFVRTHEHTLSNSRTLTHSLTYSFTHVNEYRIQTVDRTIWASQKIFVWMNERSLNGWYDCFFFRHCRRRRHRCCANLIEQKFNSIPPSLHIPNEITTRLDAIYWCCCCCWLLFSHFERCVFNCLACKHSYRHTHTACIISNAKGNSTSIMIFMWSLQFFNGFQ